MREREIFFSKEEDWIDSDIVTLTLPAWTCDICIYL